MSFSIKRRRMNATICERENLQNYLTLSSRAPPSGISNIHNFIVLSGDVVNTSGSLDKHWSVVTDL